MQIMRFRFIGVLVAVVSLVVTVSAASAQTAQSSLLFNAYQCPADYDQVSDCTKLDGVVLSVLQDGQEVGPLTSSAAEGVEVAVQAGAALQLAVTGGQPAGTVLEETTLSFTAVEGLNTVTLVFVEQATTPAPTATVAPAPQPTAALQATTAPAPSLPSTGVGSAAGRSDPVLLLVSVGALLLVVGAIARLGYRRG